ncbi:cell wall elongation regulator TseB-like domain-containing protein [Oceanobacillus halotolerans]|uniref:cell wall elongation regulator TseB-like domain-containing protein n=1 Tax=Oceanobacillus halotolerans TaxID=2663380 RepID=UPI0013DD60CA|nr:hypothetical protein [Oceanobacillus halotolerans]
MKKLNLFPTWLKWSIAVITICMIALLVYSYYLYQIVQEQRTTGFSNSEEIVIRETTLQQIDTIKNFQGKEAYHILFGSTDDTQEQIAFLNLDNDQKDIVLIDQDEIISEKQAVDEWSQTCDECEFIKISPAMINERPLWELTYRDEKDRYVLDYISMYDGSQYEQLRFKQTFE